VTIPAPNTNSNSKRNYSGNSNKPSFVRWKRIRIEHLQSHPRLTLANKAVGVAVIERANHHTGGWGIAAIEIASATGLTVREVRRSIRRLREEKLLAVKVSRGRTHKNYLWPLPTWNPDGTPQPETNGHNPQNRTPESYFSAENRTPESHSTDLKIYRNLTNRNEVVPISPSCKESQERGLPKGAREESKQEGQEALSGVPLSSFLEARLGEYSARVAYNLDTVARLLDDWGPCTFGAAIKIAESHGEILDRADLRELFGAGFLKTDNDGNLELVGGES